MAEFYEPILFVAECGSNHCGSLDRAVELVQAAKEFGAGAVKFQLFKAEKMYQAGTRGYRQKVAALERWEFREGWVPQLSKLARDYGMQFIMSVFHPSQIEVLRGYVDQIKISAYDLTYQALIEQACQLNVPIILSTAMATPQEIEQAIRWCIDTHEADAITLLHGVASYPAPAWAYSSGVLSFLHSTGCKIGLSDHTYPGLDPAPLAHFPLTLWERHFRQFTTLPESPDYEVSCDPLLFKEFTEKVQKERVEAERRLTEGPLEMERKLYATCRRSNEQPFRR